MNARERPMYTNMTPEETYCQRKRIHIQRESLAHQRGQDRIIMILAIIAIAIKLNSVIKSEADRLISQYLNGNHNPGKGTKHLVISFI